MALPRSRVPTPHLEALPAEAGKPVFYADLAREMSMPNPRNLNYPLGCIGDTLTLLAEEWDNDIPHIQSIVINRQTNLPGPGFDGFLTQLGYGCKNDGERQAVLREYHSKVSAYPYWSEVLDALGVSRSRPDIVDIIVKAARSGGGEGPAHKRLKEYVRTHPEQAGLAPDHPHGEAETQLPSGDRIDVLFRSGDRVTAVEVKPAECGDAEIVRGLFQCVKYKAVLEAQSHYWQDGVRVAVKLVIGGDLPIELVPLRNSLGVKVFENVTA